VNELVVVTGADDAFAMPLAVAVRSALDALDPSWRMKLYVLDGGLSGESRERLAASWRHPRLTIAWLYADAELYRDLPVSCHVTSATYLRLLMPALLPSDVSRAVYLDADVLVRRSLGELWCEPQGGQAALAVQDLVAPYIDATEVLPNFERWRRHRTTPAPIANYRELGLAPEAKYFNGGVLVVDLDQWRRERYAEQMLACLREHRRHVLWWDQYALNVVLAGRWRELDWRWNQGAHVYEYPHWRDSPLARDEFRRLRDDPWIVHFCSPSKPWQYFCRHPYRGEWLDCLRRTAWRDWRPERPEPFFQAWWDFHWRPLRSRWKVQTRALKRAVGYERRRAA
jgi:lipopolysaccharide biosynthesis glycosyltransferase